MVIGLKYGKVTDGDEAAKERTYALVQEFLTTFRAMNGSINCTELVDMTCVIRSSGNRLMSQKQLQENARS